MAAWLWAARLKTLKKFYNGETPLSKSEQNTAPATSTSLSPLASTPRLIFSIALLALALVFWLAEMVNHAYFAGAGALFYFVIITVLGGCTQASFVQQAARVSLRLFALAIGVFLLWALWYDMNNASPQNILLQAAPWLLAFTPFFLVFSVRRAFDAQAGKLAAAGVNLSRPQVLHDLATLSHLFLNRTGVVTPENLTIQVVMPPEGKPILLKGLDFDATKRASMWRLGVATTLCNQSSGEGGGASSGLSNDGVDMAFARFARRMNLNRKDLLRHFPLKHFLPFDPEKRYEASFHQHKGKTLVAVKGAPEVVARLCGTPQAQWLQEVDNLAQGGYRTIAVAGGQVAAPDEASLEGNLTFLGLVALVDPIKEQAAESVSACQVAGLRVKLLTGDHPATALASAKALNIAARNDELLSGDDLAHDAPESHDFANRVTQANAFARLTPRQKGDIVAACGAQGFVTAAYGHTPSDGPAVQAARMAIRGRQQNDSAGVQADKEQMILEKGNIALLPEAIKRGRLAVANARKASRLVLALMVAEVGALTGFAFLGVPQALSPVALVWVNVFLLALLVLPFAREPADRALMRRQPAALTEPLLNTRTLSRIFVDGVVMAAAIVGVTLWHLDRAIVPPPFAQSLPLNLLVLLALVYVFFARRGDKTSVAALWQNPLMWGMVLLVAALQGAVILNSAMLHSLFGAL